jgi:hypothetical protein
MQSERGQKIAGLKLPVRKRTVDEFEAERHPLHGFQHVSRAGSGFGGRLELDDDLRLDARGTHACHRQRGVS